MGRILFLNGHYVIPRWERLLEVKGSRISWHTGREGVCDNTLDYILFLEMCLTVVLQLASFNANARAMNFAASTYSQYEAVAFFL